MRGDSRTIVVRNGVYDRAVKGTETSGELDGSITYSENWDVLRTSRSGTATVTPARHWKGF